MTASLEDRPAKERLVTLSSGSAPTPRGRRSIPPALRPAAVTWIWGGVAVVVAGFVLIAVGWGGAAGESDVYRQLPYLASATAVGLGLVLTGLVLLNMASRARDATQRDQQIDELVGVIEELREALLEQRGQT